MNILSKFEKFNETIFLKQNSELEKQVNILKQLQNEYPNSKVISQKLKYCEIGLKGEKNIEFELKNSNVGMYVLHDINIIVGDVKSQIDYIVIAPAGAYFIECKNLIGNITVNEKGDFIREYYYEGVNRKQGMYSPLTQAERHIEAFKKVWDSRHKGIVYKLINPDLSWLKPLVVMANSKNILNVTAAPKEIRNRIIKSDSLVNYIKTDISKCSKDLLSTKEEMYKDAYSIIANYHKELNKDYKKEYIDLIREEVKEKLLNFRKNKAIEKSIPENYIFNDEELDNIIKALPKTVEEMKEKNILNRIRLNLHGRDIINVINT